MYWKIGAYLRFVTQPDIHAYLDYRSFLRDWFQAKKAANRRFSHRAFSRLAGQKSPSLLVDVIDRRRNLTASLVEAFIRAMKLTAAEGEFFAALVRLDQAGTATERNQAWANIAATKRFREAQRLEGAGFEFLSHWYYPAIHELARRDDFVADPAWIAKTLRPTIKVSEAKRALKALLDLQLLERGDDGSLRPRDVSVVTPHEVAGLAARNYHVGMLERAGESIDGFDPDDRHLCGVTVAIPSSLVPKLKLELDAVQERLLDLCDSTDESRDMVVQIGLHVFPLSDRSAS